MKRWTVVLDPELFSVPVLDLSQAKAALFPWAPEPCRAAQGHLDHAAPVAQMQCGRVELIALDLALSTLRASHHDEHLTFSGHCLRVSSGCWRLV